MRPHKPPESNIIKQKGERRVELLHWAETVLKYLVQFGIILLEGTGAVVLLFSAVKSVVRLCRKQPHARLSIAQGIALALCFKLGGEVLRTVIVREWSELLVLGAIIFQFVYAVALRFEMPAFMLKLVSSVIVIAAISGPYLKKQFPILVRKLRGQREGG